ncbi:MAG: DUF2723 domain-containing protein [Bacteroidia bacterium]|nr:DUF2723 domain-containing protein [Bacteroidia bacterium]
MMNYRKLNNITGWVVFAIALLSYMLTVAPTASFWDCGEFIAVANELEVPHPPGAPFFLLVGRIFAIFAPSPDKVAYFVNLVSVFSGAFTSLFVCWTITMFAKKVIAPDEENPSLDKILAILFSGVVGGLACTYADSIWFSTVEAEVYAMSAFFTAVLFWLMLKWEARANEPNNLRWIILIAYTIGLSIGVHLLNLLAIPAIALIYYNKKYNFSPMGALAAIGISFVILAVILFGVNQVTFDIAWGFEKFFVGTENTDGETSGLGMPFGTGIVVFIIMLLALLAFGIHYTHKKKFVLANTAILSLTMIYLGFSSYAIIFIRSKANTPIDENNPENIVDFLKFLKREQYGETPALMYGPMYNAQAVQEKDGKMNYVKILHKTRYTEEGYRKEYEYTPGSKKLFPRMYSSAHYDSPLNGYKNFVRDKGDDENSPYDDNPTLGDNIRYFFQYQCYHMYLRYFLFNFVGRSSDIQDSDWESGLNFVKTAKMPESMRKDPTRNHYYALPLLLGLLGLVWQYNYAKKDFWVVMLLFLFTGLMIIVYLNTPPAQPRERDYAFAGSFQTFTIWIGLGVVGLTEIIRKFLKDKASLVSGVLSLILVPGIMAKENWHDHSRAGNYVAPDSAYNMLNSCAENAIIFTNGDNDTFPLWYIQEVENVRPDVRVVNLSLLNTDWYIHQLKNQKSNQSDPLPISLPESYYIGERNAYAPFKKQIKRVPVDKESFIKNQKIDIPSLESGNMEWEVAPRGGGDQTYLLKQDLLILDMVETNAKQGWKRPIYFAITIPTSSFVSLSDFFQMEGMAYRLTPVRFSKSGNPYGGHIAQDIMYENLMKKFRFRNLDNPDIFYDANVVRMVSNFRNNFYRLVNDYVEEVNRLENENLALAASGNAGAERLAANKSRIEFLKQRGIEVNDYSMKVIDDRAVQAEAYFLALMARNYNRLGSKDKSDKLYQIAKDRAIEKLKYAKDTKTALPEDDLNLYALQVMMQLHNDDQEFTKAAEMAKLYAEYSGDAQFLEYARQIEARAKQTDTSKITDSTQNK